MKSKKQRRKWWASLSDSERAAYIDKKVGQKHRRLGGNYESNCKVFPVVDDSNRQEWQDKIESQNPWLNDYALEDEHFESEKYQELRATR